MKKLNIAIFGGSFNPIHIGHEKIISYLEEKYDLVLIVPIDNYRKKKSYLSLDERINLIKEIYKENPKIKIIDENLRNKNITYTYHCINHIRSLYKKDKLDLIIGTDYSNIDDWFKADLIKKELNKIILVRREGYDVKKVDTINLDLPSISSTELRKKLNKKNLNPITYQFIKNRLK